MLILLSPAKKLDFASAPPPNAGIPSQPRLLTHSEQLIQPLKTHSAADLAQLMRLSDKLAQLNYQRYQDWSLPFTPENAKVALAMFHGDVYEGLQADTLAAEHWNYAQQHLRILSGLYGVLSPLDLIQPYRLEMGTPFANQHGKDLYAFWGETITQQLNQDLQALKPTDTETVNSVATRAATALLPVINLASNEYFKAVKKPLLQAKIITPVFKDMKNGQYKMISFYAKRARGLMARYLLETQPENNTALQAALLNFQSEGYAYNAALTTNTREPVFTRQRE